MKKKLCIIACDHGLGHIRRSLLIAKEWQYKGYKVSIFAPKQKVEHGLLAPIVIVVVVVLFQEVIRSGPNGQSSRQKGKHSGSQEFKAGLFAAPEKLL